MMHEDGAFGSKMKMKKINRDVEMFTVHMKLDEC